MRGKPTIGTCRLCRQEAELVDSHVIPKFQYKSLKEKEGHFYVISTDSEKKTKKEQKGLTEHLLCAVCDNHRIQQNETHLAHFLHGHRKLPLDIKPSNNAIYISGYDYRRLKNALLSILWRMSISRAAFFSEVTLGEHHEERLRNALLNDIEFEEEEYAVALTLPYIDGIHYTDWIMPPDSIQIGNNRVYRCLVSGLLMTFNVGSAPLNETMKPIIVRRHQTPILKMDVRKMPFLNDLCARMGEAQRERKTPL